MAVVFNVKRRAGHPWRDDTEWDMLFVRGDDPRIMRKFLDKAREAGWHMLIDGEDDDPRMEAYQLAMVLYKPSGGGGAGIEWMDPYAWPCTEEMADDLTAPPQPD